MVGSATKYTKELSANLDRSFASLSGSDATTIINHMRTTDRDSFDPSVYASMPSF
jgi:hypothetical protein